MRPVVSRQHLMTETIVLGVTGATVTTSDSSTGLNYGANLATIKKGVSADSNLVTITLKHPLGLVPRVLIQEKTLDCVARLETTPTRTVIQIRTMELDGVTKEDDADFDVYVYGTRELREGDYG